MIESPLNPAGGTVISHDWTGPGHAPDFHQAFANILVGQHILVGVTWVSPQGELPEQQQMHGTVESAGPLGITISASRTGHDRAGFQPNGWWY